LANSRLVISHAGHGIVMKALYHGVPMILVPWGRDQPGVAARAEALGVATVIRRDEYPSRAPHLGRCSLHGTGARDLQTAASV